MPDPLPIQSINHIARVTRDLGASLEFYRDVLGFRPIERPNFGFPGAWLYNYGLQIHLIAATNEQDPPQTEISIRADHVAFHVENIREVERLLKEHYIPFESNYVEDTGVTQLFFHDPDGNHIEIGSYPYSPRTDRTINVGKPHAHQPSTNDLSASDLRNGFGLRRIVGNLGGKAIYESHSTRNGATATPAVRSEDTRRFENG